MSWQQVEHWEPWRRPSLVLSTGPQRVREDLPDPEFKPRPVGFLTEAPAQSTDVEPMLWDGDDA